jgi:flagellar basal body-associated protein FliL
MAKDRVSSMAIIVAIIAVVVIVGAALYFILLKNDSPTLQPDVQRPAFPAATKISELDSP